MKNKEKLCIFTKYSLNGPSSHYRVMIYLKDLENIYNVALFPFWNEKYYSTYMNNKKKYIIQILICYIKNIVKRIWQLYTVAPKSDIVFFQKSIVPGLKFNNLSYLKKHGCKLILDIDDAIYMNPHDDINTSLKYMYALIVGNDELKEHYSKYNHNVYVIPTVEYTPDYDKYHKDTFDNKIITWIGSSSSIDNLDLIIDSLNEVINKHPEVKFIYICNKNYGYTQKIKNSSFIKWTQDGAIEALSAATIGVMPLKDTPFNRGKCGFKLIQYMNMGKPVVASNVGVNEKIVGNGGFIANSSEEFSRYMETLLFDHNTYDKCCKYISTKFLEKYGYNVALNEIIKVLQHL